MSTTNGVGRHGSAADDRGAKTIADPLLLSGAGDAQAPPKQAEQIVHLVELQAELFHDPRGICYATVRIPLASGRLVAHTLRLHSRSFCAWVAGAARAAIGQTVSPRTIDEAVLTLEGLALYERPQESVHVRVAEHDGAIYFDLGSDTGQCVMVTGSGWEVIDRAPVRFVRPKGMRPLAVPLSGGSIQELRPFLNVDDDGFLLSLGWLMASLKPGLPCPALGLTGEQGTAKSTSARALRKVIDANIAELRSPPRNEEDLFIAACGSRVVALDNLSGLTPSLSDALCRLITGGGIGKRALYSDDDESILEAMRPVILNGIEDIADRPDLAERCIVLTLRPIPEGKRRDEKSYWRAFEAAAPRILGAILGGLVSALAHIDGIMLESMPRMADFVRWATAAEEGLGCAPGSIAAAYARNQAIVIVAALDASPIATALRALLRKKGGRWEGDRKSVV